MDSEEIATWVKIASAVVGVIVTVGSILWGAATMAHKIETLDSTVRKISEQLETAQEERQKAWAIACQAAEIPMDRCF